MNALVPLHFDRFNVRMVMREGVPWWVLNDVCGVLEIRNPRDAAKRLEDYQKGVGNTDTLGGAQEMLLVNEAGIYALTINSRKPEAKAFARWLFTEVLPSLRRHGTYPPPPPLPALEQPEDAHQPSLETTPTHRFMQECRRIAAERGYASVDELGLLFMSKGKWSAMKRGDGVVSDLTKEWRKLCALASWGFDLPFVLTGIYKITPQERQIISQIRIAAEERQALPES